MEHNIILRPWGSYECLIGGTNEGYLTKILIVKPGMKLSLQSHNHRSEHWIVVKGFIKAIVGESQKIVNVNQYIYVPKKEVHRIINIGNTDAVIIEVQIGDVLDENDIVRYEDDWGRK